MISVVTKYNKPRFRKRFIGKIRKQLLKSNFTVLSSCEDIAS